MIKDEVRQVLGISGGKDSAALAVYLKNLYPGLNIDYYSCDTKCELKETELLVERLESYLGRITRLVAAEGSPEDTPFDHFLKTSGGYLPSPQARWCTQKMKLAEFEKYVGDYPTISYVGIRGDENREGYVSSKQNIQTIFPFRRNIWSVDVINLVLSNKNIEKLTEIYETICDKKTLEVIIPFLSTKISKSFYYTKKLNTLLDLSVSSFNEAVFIFLKDTDYPVGKLEYFPLINNHDIISKSDVFRILDESGVGIPAYYTPIEFIVDGQKGYYNRSRSGCYFCFYQQRIEWIWLYEQHPTLFQKAMDYEKEGYTWIQGESLSELIQPERIRKIKLDQIAKSVKEKRNQQSSLLIDIFDEDDIKCANCFI